MKQFAITEEVFGKISTTLLSFVRSILGRHKDKLRFLVSKDLIKSIGSRQSYEIEHRTENRVNVTMIGNDAIVPSYTTEQSQSGALFIVARVFWTTGTSIDTLTSGKRTAEQVIDVLMHAENAAYALVKSSHDFRGTPAKLNLHTNIYLTDIAFNGKEGYASLHHDVFISLTNPQEVFQLRNNFDNGV